MARWHEESRERVASNMPEESPEGDMSSGPEIPPGGKGCRALILLGSWGVIGGPGVEAVSGMSWAWMSAAGPLSRGREGRMQ